ncbi:diguanylate cyclase (GGDEF) domain-containing protein [Desulfocapsa sulfexigens DSM 10523]|uniref:diguanylate cyclase n=1 Tax=Desulfocapsa sulfexigens (strain DSM 10523 / SB164P1) TaxID=1167006 RepID=M1PBQ3_DESSD|nr:diguanylate cyclase [Desulfocapsa sulfexigens]AGF79057.1 diguanylate cyclase (GGDEF) domain-containing protein [Desulfocapsa sulfexigens DSM 10523]
MTDQFLKNTSPIEYQIDIRNAPKGKLKNVFLILFLCMVTFGFAMGVAFPPIVKVYFSDPRAVSISFTLMCITAGITVGVANYMLFSLVVSKQLRFLVEGMNQVNKQIRSAMFSRKHSQTSYEIEVKSNDMIGQVTQAFNTMSSTVEQRLNHEASFRGIVATLSANIDLDTTSDIILRYFIETTCITSGVLYGKIEDEMILLASHDVDTDDKLPRKLEPWQGTISDTIESGTIHTIDTEANNFNWITISTPLGTFKPKFIRIIPLIADKSTVGLLIAACGDSKVSESIQKEMLETYASYMAPYLQNALLHNKIQEMASYDSLTHILNRRFGLVRLEEEFSTALRHRSDLSAIMIDIDKFKKVNDTFGHEAGDMILKNVASALALNLRNEEVICRYGGEEFLIILPMANLHKAGLVAERLRLVVERQGYYHKDKLILVTISLGVSSLSSLVTQNKNDLINTADTALYHAKHMGRNRVAIFRNNESVLLPTKV